MKISPLISIMLAIAPGLWMSVDAPAQEKAAESLQHPAHSTEMSDGVIRKIDRENKKITLRHGEIKNLEMPPMTMVFQVKDPALLDKVKPGDKVKFRAEKSAGAFVVIDIQVGN